MAADASRPGGIGWMRRLFARRLRTPLFLQLEATDCGAASLGAVLAHYGRWVPLDDLREACAVGRDGCSAADIARAARGYGLETTGWKQELSDIPRLPLPAILFWEFNHFVVLEGVGNGCYHVNDPARGRRTLDEDAFDRAFTGVALATRPAAGFRRSKAPPGVLRRLWPWLRDFKPTLAFAVLAGLLLAAPGLAAPALLSIFVDYVLAGRQADWGPVIAGAMIAAAVAAYALTWMRQLALRRLATMLSIRQSDRFLDCLLRLPAPFFARRFSGDLMARMQSIDGVVNMGANHLVGATIELLMSLAVLALMFVYDAPLALAAAAVAATCLAATRLAGRYRTEESHRLRREQGLWSGVGFAGLRNIETLRATASEDDFFVRWSGHQARELSARQRFAELGYVTEVLPELFTILGGAVILGLAGWRAMSGDMTAGMVVGFYMLTWNFLQPVGRFVRLAERLRTLEAELLRLDDIFNARSETPRAGGAVPGGTLATLDGRLRLRGRVELRGVSFGYQRHRPPLIEDLNLTIEPGQRIAIVGPSGSGKSTLSLLVAGTYQPWSGEILFDGVAREDVPRAVLCDSIAVVDQRPTLFEGSVRENLTMWDATMPEEQIIAAATDAAIHREIMARAGGYDALIAEGGRNFSGGQRQRLEIARALVTNPSVLILDEATAALDAATEVEVDDALRRRGCSCLIVAHRLSTVRDSDRIIVLDGGRAIQAGTHDELMAVDGGLYRELMHAA